MKRIRPNPRSIILGSTADRDRATASVGYLGGERLSCLLVRAVRKRQRCRFGRKLVRDGRPDAAARAGDQRDLTLKLISRCHVGLLCREWYVRGSARQAPGCT